MPYKLELPVEVAIHDVFHVSQLKRVVGPQAIVQSLVRNINAKFEWLIELKDVRGLRWNEASNEEEWLIHWQGQQACEATSELATFIKRQFPEFHLETRCI